MKIYTHTALSDFEFWGGAADNVAKLTADELAKLDQVLDEEYPHGLEMTEVNDMFWFDFNNLCELIDLPYDEETGEIER